MELLTNYASDEEKSEKKDSTNQEKKIDEDEIIKNRKVFNI